MHSPLPMQVNFLLPLAEGEGGSSLAGRIQARINPGKPWIFIEAQSEYGREGGCQPLHTELLFIFNNSPAKALQNEKTSHWKDQGE